MVEGGIGLFEVSVALFVILLWIGSTVWANKLKGKYLDPYILKDASPGERLQWAIRLTVVEFGALGVLLVLTLVVFSSLSGILDNISEQLKGWAICIGGLAVLCGFLVVWEYWRISRKRSDYLRWDANKRRDRLTRCWLFSGTGLLSSEVKKHFWEFGYSEKGLPSGSNDRESDCS